ncbi:MAG: transketolase [Candidatus Sungbacteria bacterium]|uniref:Transketolase n=1 Tax=Candidatus Sungiibacteriota bacterium TaxID=2750080 RepID=A0A9D6LSE6_9BACT|nr:transketolase [Candidatus Sungbacteria bacterium]
MGELGGVITETAKSLQFIPLSEIKRVKKSIHDPVSRAKILADIFRLNALYMIMNAGSGHIGSSFSAMDIVTWLWTEVLKNPNNVRAQESDIYFSSKGHDAPGLYAVMAGIGKLDFDLIHALRRMNGLPGHPDVATPGIAANTGALGMGISKAKGMALARRLENKKGTIYVLTGDGELQEGQFWESLQPTANAKLSEIVVIIDHNKIQSDTWVRETSDLGDLEYKLRAFSWEVARCNGNDVLEIKEKLEYFRSITDKPKMLIADTKKGAGVSFMEEVAEDGFYKFHSGAPSLGDYERATRELVEKINQRLGEVWVQPIQIETRSMPARTTPQNPERLVSAYSDELIALAKENKDILALDADLILDTGLIPFKKQFPDRFFECGIAEQDMVSTAGGMALAGKIPIVHSFACFLSTRPNEQIYNNITEKKKVIYVASLAGVLPAGPGHSHQSVRDISAVGGMPGLILIEPANEAETKMALRWAVNENTESTYLRLVSIPSEINYKLPHAHQLIRGQGVKIKDGNKALIISYGPSMLIQAVKAAEILDRKSISTAVINMPWLNCVDASWLEKEIQGFSLVMTLDDHYTNFGQGMLIAGELGKINFRGKIITHGIMYEIPASGQNTEVLKYHKLYAESLAAMVQEGIG